MQKYTLAESDNKCKIDTVPKVCLIVTIRT